MSICLRHIEAIIHDQFFFTDFIPLCSVIIIIIVVVIIYFTS